jgi:PAS domain-containing protein
MQNTARKIEIPEDDLVMYELFHKLMTEFKGHLTRFGINYGDNTPVELHPAICRNSIKVLDCLNRLYASDGFTPPTDPNNIREFTELGRQVLDVIVPDELPIKLEDDDIIEFYQADGLFLFASTRMYDMVSYSPETLMGSLWHELFVTPQRHIERVQQAQAKAMALETNEVFTFEPKPHISKERFGPARSRSFPKALIPYRSDDGVLKGMLYICSSKLLKEGEFIQSSS